MSTLPRIEVAEVFAHALRGEACFFTAPGQDPLRVPIEEWARPVDDGDRAMLDLCEGATIDLGCGPGRLTVELGERGHCVLGVDVVYEAVLQTRRRGGVALRRDLFDRLPGEGRWDTALLADGNVGIGGDPVTLLARVRRLVGAGGRVVVEVASEHVRSTRLLARLECDCSASGHFPWAILGLGDVAPVAAAAGLVEIGRHRLDRERWVVVLQERDR
ncbi:MAG: class I SAM-dependent methyltransferase [Nocardioides sp.]